MNPVNIAPIKETIVLQGQVTDIPPAQTHTAPKLEEQEGFASRWVPWAREVSKFSNGMIGAALINTGKAIVGENVGMLIGAALPEASIGYAIGKNVANTMISDSENKSMVVQGAAVLAGVTAHALSKGLEYLTGVDGVKYGTALAYMVKASGTIAGGMSGLEAMGQTVPKDYAVRSFAYLATTDAVSGTAATVASLPLPKLVTTPVDVALKVAKPIVGAIAYSAPEALPKIAEGIEKLANPTPAPPSSKPKEDDWNIGTMIQRVAENSYGSTGAFVSGILDKANKAPADAPERADVEVNEEVEAKKLIDSPLLLGLVQMIVKDVVDSKRATNGLVRAVNDFVKILGEDSIQEAIKKLKAQPSEIRKTLLKQAIIDVVKTKYTSIENILVTSLRPRFEDAVPTIAESLVKVMSEQEEKITGFNILNTNQAKDFLEVILPEVIPFIGMYVKRELFFTKELAPEEVQAFYQSMNKIIFAPYSDYKLARGAQGLVSAALPKLLKMNFIPKLLAEVVGRAMIPTIMSFGDEEESDFYIPKATDAERQAQSQKPVQRPTLWQMIRKGFSAVGRKIFSNTRITFAIRDTVASLIRRPTKKDSTTEGR